jgi:hypothetical protein
MVLHARSNFAEFMVQPMHATISVCNRLLRCTSDPNSMAVNQGVAARTYWRYPSAKMLGMLVM